MFIMLTNCDSLPPTSSASAIAASLPDWTIMPYTRSCTVTGLFASMNMRDSSVRTRRTASLGMTVWSMLIFFVFSASKTRYAVISLVSDAGSTRSSGLPEASTWLLVASTSTHERAFTAGGGTCANAVLATSVAGSTTPRVTARRKRGRNEGSN